MMSSITGTAEHFVEMIKAKDPALLDLLTAQTDDVFDAALDTLIAHAIEHLEKNSDNFNSLGEVGLTAVLVASLSVPDFLAVNQEAHSNGHVDVTISTANSRPPRTRLGEAKIWHGYAYHIDGLTQLIGRYSTGRDGRGLMFVYFKNTDISGRVKNLRTKMDNDRPHAQKGPTEDHQLKWAFLSTHLHSSGEDINVAHFGCNLHSASANNKSETAEHDEEVVNGD